MSRPELPSVAEIDELAPVHRQVAGPEWEDGNGHVNVRHFYDLHCAGAEIGLTRIGLGDEYRQQRRCGVFSVEQHLSFLSEVRIGEEVSVHVRWLGRGAKVFHAVTVVVNRSTGRVANTLELLEAHVDLTTRRAAPFPADLAGVIDGEVAEHSRLGWQLPLTGHMGVRRPADQPAG